MDRVIFGRQVESYHHQTPDADLGALRDLVRKVATPPRFVSCLEVGSWVGESAVAICAGFSREGGELLCVDHWKGSETDWTGSLASQKPSEPLQRFLRNTDGLPVIPFKRDSQRAAQELSWKFDMVFLDADHSYEAVAADIKAWLPKVLPGGIICGHDYCQEFPGVVQAVNELLPGSVSPAWTKVWWWQVPW